MSAPLITLIGMGDDGMAGLPQSTSARIEAADIIVGSARLLGLLPDVMAKKHKWPAPFDPMVSQLHKWAGKSVVILATGDPMWFGAGSTLLRHFQAAEFAVIPHVSAFQLAAARVGWALQNTETLSLHGRANCLIEPAIQPAARLLVLTSGATSIAEIAARFVARGFGESRFTVLEHMGGAAENHTSFSAQAVPDVEFSGFHTLAIECIAGATATILPRAPGLPDDAYDHDGQLTKREVRAATLAALSPTPHTLLWDVGAGCGSIAIEWLRAAPHTEAIAFERGLDRIAMIEHNRQQLGVPHLQIMPGNLPETLTNQPAPDAVFIGGDVANTVQFETCWSALKSQGRLVANAVTLEGQAHLIALQARLGGDLVRIGIEHLSEVGSKRAMRPRMTVTQWRKVKP
ncbi:MAG: precorrin-6y C5,15-methyltransferase (decarboxylating) subunit CbiE [Hyphomicrobiales bacterium]|nr:precorrin-6y C5,15-methyltransferase (decarboxylating) subunit CbiE [Hyphomicrobiales bacterium]